MKTKQNKTAIHFTDRYLLKPTNPVSVNLIGAGGTGSMMLTALGRMNHALNALNHAGLQVTVFDTDFITSANQGRQLFAEAEIGLNKAAALINRINRFFGTNWKAVPKNYNRSLTNLREYPANLTISCVDSAKARFEIAEILKSSDTSSYSRDRSIYWMDFGNSRFTGQCILSTVGKIQQPASKKFKPVAYLPFITDEYRSLLEEANSDDMPSCSLAEALTKQDLFINSSLANEGASLLWQLFREGMTENRGFFKSQKDFRTMPLKVA